MIVRWNALWIGLPGKEKRKKWHFSRFHFWKLKKNGILVLKCCNIAIEIEYSWYLHNFYAIPICMFHVTPVHNHSTRGWLHRIIFNWYWTSVTVKICTLWIQFWFEVTVIVYYTKIESILKWWYESFYPILSLIIHWIFRLFYYCILYCFGRITPYKLSDRCHSQHWLTFLG